MILVALVDPCDQSASGRTTSSGGRSGLASGRAPRCRRSAAGGSPAGRTRPAGRPSPRVPRPAGAPASSRRSRPRRRPRPAARSASSIAAGPASPGRGSGRRAPVAAAAAQRPPRPRPDTGATDEIISDRRAGQTRLGRRGVAPMSTDRRGQPRTSVRASPRRADDGGQHREQRDQPGARAGSTSTQRRTRPARRVVAPRRSSAPMPGQVARGRRPDDVDHPASR